MAERKQWSPMRPAARAFMEESKRLPDSTLFKRIHGYVYTRWPYLYISVGRGNHWLAKVFTPPFLWIARIFPRRRSLEEQQDSRVSGTIADGYHGKVMPLETAQRLIMVQESIELRDLEKVIPYPTARDIILHNPDHIAVLECPCRASVENPCLPMDVCLIVGEPMVSMVRKFHPERSRIIDQEEAADILQAEHERGHVHHAFFKDAILGRYYAICNCCSCCCGAMQAHANAIPMLASSGYERRVDENLCSGCESCVDVCQFGALSVQDGLAVVDLDRCMGCGVCVSVCAQGALSLERNPARGEPLEIAELMAAAQGSSSSAAHAS